VSRLLARLGVVATVSCGLVLGAGFVAGAHVSVSSDEAVQGGHAEIAFRVPTESDTTSTVKLQVAFPTDTPITSVSVLPHPGWTYKVTKAPVAAPVPDGHGGQVTQAVSQIEWSAAGPDTAVKPGEYEVFRVSAGPLPKADRAVFKVLQTYSDGQVVRWIDEPAVEGAPQPEHPAAVLALAPAGASASDAHAGHLAPAVATTTTGGGTPPVAWWALAATAMAVLAALWAVLVAVRTARRGGGDQAVA
jgi:periplasmic copper chaperone A